MIASNWSFKRVSNFHSSIISLYIDVYWNRFALWASARGYLVFNFFPSVFRFCFLHVKIMWISSTFTKERENAHFFLQLIWRNGCLRDDELVHVDGFSVSAFLQHLYNNTDLNGVSFRAFYFKRTRSSQKCLFLCFFVSFFLFLNHLFFAVLDSLLTVALCFVCV